MSGTAGAAAAAIAAVEAVARDWAVPALCPQDAPHTQESKTA